MLINRTGGGGENVTAEVEAQTPIIQSLLDMYQTVGQPTGATATADKILEGYTAYVDQNLITGILKTITAQMFGCTKIDIQTVNPSADTRVLTVTHNLGVTPKFVMALSDITNLYSGADKNVALNAYCILGSRNTAYYVYAYSSSNTLLTSSGNDASMLTNNTETQAYFSVGVTFQAGREYTVIVMS